MKTFNELSLSPILKSNLVKNSFVEPTPVQSQAIPPRSRATMWSRLPNRHRQDACLCPADSRITAQKQARHRHQLVVLSPTRELALQIGEAFALMAAGTGIRAAVVVGGMSEHQQLLAIRRGAQVLIATPGRLCDFLERKAVTWARCASLFWMKPTACSTWVSSPRLRGSSAPCPPNGRPCSSPPPSKLRWRTWSRNM